MKHGDEGTHFYCDNKNHYGKSCCGCSPKLDCKWENKMSEPNPLAYECPYCYKIFNTSGEREKHLWIEHGKEKLK